MHLLLRGRKPWGKSIAFELGIAAQNAAKLNRKPELPARMLELGLSDPVRVPTPLAQLGDPSPG